MKKAKKSSQEPCSDIPGRIGEIIYKHRRRLNYTLRQLGELANLQASMILRAERGDHNRQVKITIERLCKLSVGLGQAFSEEIAQFILDYLPTQKKGARN